MTFVRHARAVVDPAVPTEEWPIDPTRVGDIEALQRLLPDAPVVSSTMRRAVETAQFFGRPQVDPRLAEVSRSWDDGDFRDSIARYFRGEPVEGWEPRQTALGRVRAVVDEHGDAIYVSHGTLLTIYLASIVREVDAMAFWEDFRNPDAWQLDGTRLTRLAP